MKLTYNTLKCLAIRSVVIKSPVSCLNKNNMKAILMGEINVLTGYILYNFIKISL